MFFKWDSNEFQILHPFTPKDWSLILVRAYGINRLPLLCALVLCLCKVALLFMIFLN